MGISKSTQFDKFDRNFTPNFKKTSPVVLKENFREKHIPEYPPLIICKDSECQTNVSYPCQEHLNLSGKIKKRHIGMILLGIYLVICLIVSLSEGIQRIGIYMHIINYPFDNLDNLYKYEINNGRNIKYQTNDGLMIHGWHILPPGEISQNSSKISSLILREKYFNTQLRQAKTIIIQLHGNAANRGVSRRIQLMKQLASESGAHVIAIDYRGFGDSEGYPTEEGITKDMFGLWKWLEESLLDPHTPHAQQTRPKIFIYALSLGTGIAVEFLHHLSLSRLQADSMATSSLYPDGLILHAPFSSIADVIHDYPYAAPLRLIPFVFRIVSRFLIFHYPTITNIHSVRCPILILHGHDDTTIPVQHSRRIIKAFAESSQHDKNSTLSPSSSPPLPLHSDTTCSLRVKAVENGDVYSGMECVPSLPDTHSSPAAPVLPLITLVEFPHGTHENLFHLNEWLATVPEFITRCSEKR